MSQRAHLEQLIEDVVKAEADRAEFGAAGWKNEDDRRTKTAVQQSRANLNRWLDQHMGKR